MTTLVLYDIRSWLGRKLFVLQQKVLPQGERMLDIDEDFNAGYRTGYREGRREAAVQS